MPGPLHPEVAAVLIHVARREARAGEITEQLGHREGGLADEGFRHASRDQALHLLDQYVLLVLIIVQEVGSAAEAPDGRVLEASGFSPEHGHSAQSFRVHLIDALQEVVDAFAQRRGASS